jgi:hypothetical protein
MYVLECYNTIPMISGEAQSRETSSKLMRVFALAAAAATLTLAACTDSGETAAKPAAAAEVAPTPEALTKESKELFDAGKRHMAEAGRAVLEGIARDGIDERALEEYYSHPVRPTSGPVPMGKDAHIILQDGHATGPMVSFAKGYYENGKGVIVGYSVSPDWHQALEQAVYYNRLTAAAAAGILDDFQGEQPEYVSVRELSDKSLTGWRQTKIANPMLVDNEVQSGYPMSQTIRFSPLEFKDYSASLEAAARFVLLAE